MRSTRSCTRDDADSATSSTPCATAVIDVPTWTALDPERRTLRDVDTPEDLAR